MAAKLSKEVTDRKRDGLWVLSAFQTHGPEIAECFGELSRPHLGEGDEEPKPGAFLTALARGLEAALDHLVATDLRVAETEARESALRQRHKEAVRRLGLMITALRRTVLGQYLEPNLANLALLPLEARDSITVVRRAQLIGERFQAANLSELLGQARFEDPVDVTKHADEIHAAALDLLKRVEEVHEAGRKSARARTERSEAKDAYDRVFLRSTRIFEDLCRLAGKDGLAGRVRSSTHIPVPREDSDRDENENDLAAPEPSVQPPAKDPPQDRPDGARTSAGAGRSGPEVLASAADEGIRPLALVGQAPPADGPLSNIPCTDRPPKNVRDHGVSNTTLYLEEVGSISPGFRSLNTPRPATRSKPMRV